MKKGKLLLIIVLVLIIILLLIGGFIFFKMQTKPDKVFSTAIASAFQKIKEKQYVTVDTIKADAELSAGIKSENDDLKSINEVLEASKLILNTEIDFGEKTINQNINIEKDDDDLIDAELLVKGEKSYIFLNEWFDKYIEMSLNEDSINLMNNLFSGSNHIDKALLIDTLEQEINNKVQQQNFESSKDTMTIDGQTIKVNKSSIRLNEEQLMTLYKEILTDLENNNNFKISLGECAEFMIAKMDEKIKEISNQEFNNNNITMFSIYTRGFKNEFVAADVVTQIDGTLSKTIYTKINENKSQFGIYVQEDDEVNNLLTITFEKNNNEGTITISIPTGDEATEVLLKYQKTELQTNYELTTEISNIKVNLNGGIIKTENKYSGNFMLSIENEQNEKYNLNGVYNVTYNAEIEKKTITDAVKYENLTEEEKQQIKEKMEEKELYKFYEDNSDVINQILGLVFETRFTTDGENKTKSENRSITNGSYITTYKEPESYKVWLDGKGRKEYYDDNGNIIKMGFVKDESSYLLSIEAKKTENEDENATNVQVSQTKKYKINNIEYKYKIVTYEETTDEEGNKGSVNLYFIHKIDDGSSFYLEMISPSGEFAMEDIDLFLDITIE